MRYKTGRYTTGITFILLGIVVFLHQITDTNWLGVALKWWPLVIIGYGLEYLLFARSQERTRFDFGGAIFIAFLLLILSAYSFFGGFMFNISDLKHATPDDPIYFAEGEVNSFDVEGMYGKIILEPSQDGRVTILPTYRSNGEKSLAQLKDEVGLSTSLVDGNLVVKGHKLLGSKVGFNFFGIKQSGVDLHIYAPAETVAKISNNFGNIEIHGMENLRSAKQNFGDIIIFDSKGDLKVNSDFGSVKIRNFSGLLNVKSNFGDVNADGEMHGKWEFKNDFGTVKLALPEDSSFDYYFNVDFGSRDLPNPPFTSKDAGSIHGGKFPLKIDVSFGSIEVDLK